MIQCPCCLQNIPENGPINVGEVLIAVSEQLNEGVDFWENTSSVTQLRIRNGNTPVEFIARQGPMRGSGYNDLPVGTTSDIWVIFKVGNQFFRKTGYGDSYADAVWDGPIREVKQTEKKVMVWE